MKSLIIFSASVLACGAAAVESPVHFHGTLYKLSCKVNNDKPVDIDFGKVGVNKVDGVQFSKSIPISIQCDETPSSKLNLTVTGAVSDFDNGAVQSNVPDLAIQVQQNGKEVKIGEPFLVSESNPPVLIAVPVKRAGMELVGGEFSAVATLVIQGD